MDNRDLFNTIRNRPFKAVTCDRLDAVACTIREGMSARQACEEFGVM
jgi:hypothetical protein